MNKGWGLSVIDSVNVKIPVQYDSSHRSVNGIVQTQVFEAASNEFKWKMTLQRGKRDSNCRFDIDTTVCLATGCGRDRWNYCRVIVEVSNESSSKSTFSFDEMEYHHLVFDERGRVFRHKYPDGSLMDVLIKVVSKPNPDALHMNGRIKMFNDGKTKGDIILKIHGANSKENDKKNEEEMTCRPRKRRRIMSLEEEGDENTEIEGKPIIMKTYSSVLRSQSPHFASMLDIQMKEREEGVIQIHAANAKDAEGMIFYLFTGRLKERKPLNGSTMTMIRLAHLYQLSGLFELCRQKLIHQVRVSNYVQTVQVFNRYEIEKGMDELIQFGKDNLDRLKGNDVYQYHELPFIFRLAVLEKKRGDDPHYKRKRIVVTDDDTDQYYSHEDLFSGNLTPNFSSGSVSISD